MRNPSTGWGHNQAKAKGLKKLQTQGQPQGQMPGTALDQLRADGPPASGARRQSQPGGRSLAGAGRPRNALKMVLANAAPRPAGYGYPPDTAPHRAWLCASEVRAACGKRGTARHPAGGHARLESTHCGSGRGRPCGQAARVSPRCRGSSVPRPASLAGRGLPSTLRRSAEEDEHYALTIRSTVGPLSCDGSRGAAARFSAFMGVHMECHL